MASSGPTPEVSPAYPPHRSTALRQHRVGLEEVDDGIWSLYFCDVLSGRIDERQALMKGQLGVTHVPG
jgi:hypothetical protein